MTALKVLGIIALVLFLLSMIRLGAAVEFSGSGLMVRIKAGALQFTVFPRKSGRQKREKKSAKSQKEKKKPEEGEASAKGGALALVQEFLPLAADAAGRVKRTIRIDRFYLDLTMAAGDPALAAMGFGGANAVLGMLWPPIEQNFNVKDWRLRTAVDFQLQAPVVWLQAAATLSVGQIVSLGAHLGIRAVRILRARQAAERAEASVLSTQKEAV